MIGMGMMGMPPGMMGMGPAPGMLGGPAGPGMGPGMMGPPMPPDRGTSLHDTGPCIPAVALRMLVFLWVIDCSHEWLSTD